MRYRCVEDGSEIVCRQPPLGAGGEGAVYATTRPGLVAKIYHPRRQPTDRMVDKLEFMRDNPPEQPPSNHGHVAITWPRALLERKGRVRGFLLDASHGESMDKAMNPGERKRFFPGQNWRFSLAVAHNLAWVVEKIHDKGFVIGDVNTQNLRVLPDGQVSIIDTDSFQISPPGGGRVYPCGVMTPEFSAPELTPGLARDGRRTPAQDRFSLAVVAYGLLACGKHPFNGVFTGAGEPPDTREAILKGYSLFHPAPPFSRAGKGPTPDFLPAELRRLFVRAFVAGAKRPDDRPAAAEWREALWTLAGGAGLKNCARNPFHAYPAQAGDCVWCGWARTMRYDYYDPHFKPEADRPNRPRLYRPSAPAATQLRVLPPAPGGRTRTITPSRGIAPASGRVAASVSRPMSPSAVAVAGANASASRGRGAPVHAPVFAARYVRSSAPAYVVVGGGKVRFAELRLAAGVAVLLAALWLLASFERTLPAWHKRFSGNGDAASIASGIIWEGVAEFMKAEPAKKPE